MSEKKETIPTTIDETKSDSSEQIDLNKKNREASIEKSQPENKSKPSVWTEVSSQTLQQLRDQAKITYDKLGGNNGRKEKKGPK